MIATDVLTGQKLVFENESCRFGYRDSIFKQGWKDKCIITSVIFRLSKKPALNISYQQVADLMSKKDRQDVESLREVIIGIRQSKLPDPAEIGNAGSFFKNPVISQEKYDDLHTEFPDLPSYPVQLGIRKIPAAWLIEKCGWKGKKLGRAACYEKQPLVLVNLGNASGREILELAERIQTDIQNRFGVSLGKEVNVI